VRARIRPYKKLRAAIVEAGYNQEDVAKAIGIDRSTFNQKINGHYDFTLPESIRIARLLHKTLDDIFFTD
jgi:DNA-binding XRE family transcriptional regulator